MRRVVLISLIAGCIPLVQAQRSFTGPRVASHFGGHSFAGRHSRGYGNAFPWFWDSFYGDDDADYPPPQERTPLQRTLTAETATTSTAEPLLIELQGDRYVRLSGEENSREKMLDVVPTDTVRNSAPATSIAPLKPAVLVFRDGQREEVSAYSISGGALYIQSDFYVSGSWHQRIELRTLDLPATVAENRSRGIRFQLPNAPNEVIVGP